MAKYRVKQIGDWFYPQFKFIFWWNFSEYGKDLKFFSLKQAKERIEEAEQESVYFDMYETIGDFSFENNCFIVQLNGSLTTTDQADLFDKLNEWHMNWRNIPESDYVKVSSLTKSPYA